MVKDADLFAAAMADVKRLDGRRRLARAAAKAAPPPPAAKPLPAKRRPVAPVEPDLSVADKSFDRDVARALSRGKLAPEATLDLHGMTLVAAERAVGQFLGRAADRDFRIVLIVTGKGLREEGGRLVGGRIRAEFIGWLNRVDNRARVRSVRPAHPHHGGSGAFYVLLRRRSSASKRSLRATPQR
ncbi:MAG: DNA mismatch repair protein MutS [Reyranella sp.]|uniref:Smr/MutS family protein n=1 Tax=Reyranella sp. TaxID=1929291 RepID=UPI001227E016|nr:Smr/MutS family protein [Reyranella sp.]TAJ42890.1 MAG: DNA mismatch repair protein MutS [Reyranella sp.]